MFFIGIDPGVNTGFAIWDSKKKLFVELRTIDFWRTVEQLDKWYPFKEQITVVMEDVEANAPVFAKRSVANVSAFLKIAQNVGMVKKEQDLLCQKIEALGYKLKKVRPGKNSMTKLKAEDFRRITRYEGSTSSHSRDAGMLVFGY